MSNPEAPAGPDGNSSRTLVIAAGLFVGGWSLFWARALGLVSLPPLTLSVIMLVLGCLVLFSTRWLGVRKGADDGREPKDHSATPPPMPSSS